MQALHLDISSPNHEMGTVLDGIGKNIQEMKAAVGNKDRDMPGSEWCLSISEHNVLNSFFLTGWITQSV